MSKPDWLRKLAPGYLDRNGNIAFTHAFIVTRIDRAHAEADSERARAFIVARKKRKLKEKKNKKKKESGWKSNAGHQATHAPASKTKGHQQQQQQPAKKPKQKGSG